MKYYLLAGEASGDLHGAYLMKAILEKDPQAEFRFWGGDKMAAVAGELVVHYKERSFMGFAKVVANLPKVLGFLKRAKKDIAAWQPDRLVLIDNSGFNLPVAKWAKEQGFSTHYYISPQVWASRESRVKTIKACVDKMYVVLPFVKDFYAKHNYEVEYVGHPLLEVVGDFLEEWSGNESIEAGRESWTFGDFAGFCEKTDIPVFQNTNILVQQENFDGVKEKSIIALLPGSRTQEIKSMLPIMLAAAASQPDYCYVIAQAPSQPQAFYQKIIQEAKERPAHLMLVNNATYPLFASAHAALVTSGTATLEAGLFEIPQVVCYKGSALEYQIAKRLIKVDYISLVNLAVNKQLVPELIQNELTVKNLSQHLANITEGPARTQQLQELAALKKVLGSRGAPQRAAAFITATTPK